SVTELSAELSAKINNLIGGIVKVFVAIPGLALLQFLISHYQWPSWVSFVSWLAGSAIFVLGLIQIRKVNSKKSSQRKSTSADELYDDEIASYYFEKTLKNLKGSGFKIVFILDELDKVNNTEISNLINEMK